MKNIFKLLLVSLIFTACEDVEPTIYNGTQEEGTFLSFSQTTYSLPIERDATGTLEIIVNSSTVSNVDRTYNVVLVPSTSSSAANPATYSFPGTVTIPAGQYQGILVVSGVDNDLVDGTKKTFQIRLEGLTNEDIDADVASVEVFEVCPLMDDFLGTYTVEQLTPEFAPAGTTAIQEGTIELVMGRNAYERQFLTSPYPGFGLPSFQFIISFECDVNNLAASVDTGIGCSADANIEFRRTTSPSAYDTTDDSTFDVTFTENATGQCNAPAMQTTLRFTKVE